MDYVSNAGKGLEHITLRNLENTIKDFETPFFSNIYKVEPNQSCRLNSHRVLHYPWYGAYPTCDLDKITCAKEILHKDEREYTWITGDKGYYYKN